MSSNIKLLIAVLTFAALNTEARDFGRQGAVFEIREEGFIAMIQRKLAGVDIERHYRLMVEKVKERVASPPAVSGISRAVEDREFYYDPAYIVKEDIKLPDGTVLYKAGTEVNPLTKINFDRRLILIDGRDAQQVEWLKKYEPDSNYVERIILVGGRIFDLQEELGKQLYFDQAGEITSNHSHPR